MVINLRVREFCKAKLKFMTSHRASPRFRLSDNFSLSHKLNLSNLTSSLINQLIKISRLLHSRWNNLLLN